MTELVLFDLDGTLIEGHVTRDGDSGPFEQILPFETVNLLPGRKQVIADLLNVGMKIGICTNKAGVAFGHQTLEDCEAKRMEVARQLELLDANGLRVSWLEAYDHPSATLEQYRQESFYRKPNPGMILHSLCIHGVDPSGARFVGDMDVDEIAAERAGVSFTHADDFFA